ncbi:hypothetical protein SSX86_031613 [Deinandra increscens subsp. villosa]|uniref:NLP1-9 GAF domain-containing protein n=1 Tax=Deinandra increscens subsp. villosa TaxID=3103831 RepID=A0AAP0C9K2_9ASTR
MGDDGNHWPTIDPARTTGYSVDCEVDSRDVLMKKIRSAFGNVKSFPLKRIVIQLWVPRRRKTSPGRKILSCYGYPYALSHLNYRLWKYRSGCCNYEYSFHDERTFPGFITGIPGFIPGNPIVITGAPPGTAFETGFPEVVLDLTVHRGTPLVDLALECELTCFMMLPVFDQTKCRGIIEVSMRQPSDLLVIFNELYHELESVGLRLTPIKALVRPLLTLPFDFKSARSEVDKALQVAVQSHAITIGRVWVPYPNCITPRRLYPVTRKLLRRLGDIHIGNPVGDDHLGLELFSRRLHVLLLRKGEGLIARTLETKRPHLCRNIYKLSENKGLMALLSTNAKSYACFVIGLRSSHTGAVTHVFEFFWPQSYHNHLALMEDLLLTLREHLPSFKYASGAQLGDESLVVDFKKSSSSSSSSGNRSGSGSETINIFPRNKKSKAPRVTRASVGMKRKSIDLHDGQSELNQYPVDEDDLVIIAFYKVCHRLFFVPSTATFENVMDKIKQDFEFELNPVRSYKVEYQVLPGKWYRLTDDTCLKNCISSYRASSDIDYIKFCVLPVEE